MNKQKLVWEDKYSVEVEEIDNQHKKLFVIINNLIDIVGTNPDKEKLTEIITSIVEYKKNHFETEEKYFKEFNYEGAEEHIAEHSSFNEKLSELQAKYLEDVIDFTFALIDFLEDWLINHLLTLDHKYIDCFKSNGLK